MTRGREGGGQDGLTALMFAASHGDMACVDALLAAGADAALQDKVNSLFFCVGVVQMLDMSGASLCVRSEHRSKMGCDGAWASRKGRRRGWWRWSQGTRRLPSGSVALLGCDAAG